MSDMIFLPETAVVKDYSATVKGPMSIITVKIEVTDTYALHTLLTDLGSMKATASRRSRSAAK